MAAKKKASKKSVAKAGKGGLPAKNWQQALAANVADGKAPKEKPLTGDYISIKGGKFKLGGTKIGLDGKGEELDCVVIAWCFEKSYYDTPFSEDEKSSPACAAIGYDEDEMIPFEKSANKQCDNCTDCWANEWESADTGKGKACNDRRRLALVVAGKDDSMELKILGIPPTSLKNWKAYVNELENLGIHPMQAACNISFDQDYDGGGIPPLVFEFVSQVTNESALNLTAAMLEPATKLIEMEPDFSNYGKAPKGKGKKKTGKKASSKKKSSVKKSKFS